MFSLAGKFVRHVLPGIMRPIRVLWNQFIGFAFLVLAFVVGMSVVRRSGDDPKTVGIVIVGIVFALFLAYFGVTSFLKARKISRS